jgi:hypothetical protein
MIIAGLVDKTEASDVTTIAKLSAIGQRARDLGGQSAKRWNDASN